MSEGFHDVRFPAPIALGSRGGPVRRTQVVTLASGHEVRNAQWAGARRRWNAGTGVRCRADVEALVAFFEAREGRRYAFRWRDPFDHGSRVGGAPTPLDQRLGSGDGETRSFALVKRYAEGGPARRITKPVPGSVLVAVDGAPVPASADPLTGIVTLADAPAPGAVVTAGFLFDVAARFDTDELVLSLEEGGGEAPDVPIVEVLER
jgi:uncharacterized protein (TIGR02217 family)